MGLAYRLLGSYAEAEDVVQDTYLAWMKIDRGNVTSVDGWLTAVCTRRAIDAARSARLSRTDYVGEWLPEPVETSHDTSMAEEHIMLAESLTTAFLIAVERLGAKERAAFILREVFETDYKDVAKILSSSEPACRKLVSRAKSNIRLPSRQQSIPAAHQKVLTDAFLEAVKTGETTELASLFSSDITFHADGGGKASAVSRPLEGIDAVATFIRKVIAPSWRKCDIRLAELNAGLGFIVSQNGQTVVALSFAYDTDGKVEDIYAMRNPDKLNNGSL